MKLVGETADPLGRSGTALAVDMSGEGAPEQDGSAFRFIIDPETGRLLSYGYADLEHQWTAIVDMGFVEEFGEPTGETGSLKDLPSVPAFD